MGLGEKLRSVYCSRQDRSPPRYALEGLPAFFGAEAEADTLVITLEDAALQLQVELFYGVFEG